jgi:bacteriochlorophyll 4-vinyl reductase
MNNDGAVLAALPLALLQSTRSHDRPGEVLEDEDLSVSLPRRLGLSGVIESQIRQYEAAARSGKRVTAEEFHNLLKLVLRRPDAEPILRQTGARVAQHQFERASPTVLKLLRILPRAATYRAIRKAAAKLLRSISGNPDVSVAGKPLHARMQSPQITAMEPAGTACALYAAAFEEIASLYLGRKANVAQTHCATNGGGYCEWRLEPN